MGQHTRCKEYSKISSTRGNIDRITPVIKDAVNNEVNSAKEVMNMLTDAGESTAKVIGDAQLYISEIIK